MSAVSMAPGSPEIGASERDDGDVDSTSQDACAKAPDHFGAGEGGEVVQYTEYIDNAKKTKTLQSGFEPQMNGDVGPDPAVANQAVQSKVPKFGAWEGGDKIYGVYFDEARKSKHSGKKINPNDPEENPDMFRPIKDSAQTQPQPRTLGDKQRTQAKVPNFGAWENNGDSIGYTETFKNATIPQFGGWNTDPSQAEGYTAEFTRAREERRPGLNNDTPRNYGRAPWMRDLFVDSRRHQPSIHEDAYGGGNRTTYDQIPLGNESQANVASTPRNLPEQKPTKQKGRRFYWFRRRSGHERNVVP